MIIEIVDSEEDPGVPPVLDGMMGAEW